MPAHRFGELSRILYHRISSLLMDSSSRMSFDHGMEASHKVSCPVATSMPYGAQPKPSPRVGQGCSDRSQNFAKELGTHNTRKHLDMALVPTLSQMKTEFENTSLSAIAKRILQNLDRQIRGPAPACTGLVDHDTISSEKLTDIRTRLLLWSGNLGVMHKPEDPRALDKRLEEAPDVAIRVREILQDLQNLLSQCEPHQK